MNIQRLIIATALALGIAWTNANASTLNQPFSNDFASNAIYLFSDDATNLSFTKVTFSAGASGWSVLSNTGDALSMAGAVLSPGSGRFQLTMNYSTLPFSFQWAEVLTGSGSNSILGSGTLSWNGSNWSANNTFTHVGAVSPAAPVPLPAPIWLLGSALVGMICIGRGTRSSPGRNVRTDFPHHQDDKR